MRLEKTIQHNTVSFNTELSMNMVTVSYFASARWPYIKIIANGNDSLKRM